MYIEHLVGGIEGCETLSAAVDARQRRGAIGV